MTNKKIVFMGAVYRGHVEATKRLVQELLNRNYDVTYYSLKKYQEIFSSMEVNFKEYPENYSLKNLINQNLTAESVNDRVFTLLNNAVFASFDLVKWGKEEFKDSVPDFIFYDNTSLWGHILANILNVSSICSATIMVINGDTINYSGEGQVYINLPYNVSNPLSYLGAVFPSNVSDVLDFISCQYSDHTITYTSPFFQRYNSYFPEDKYLFYSDRCETKNLIAKDNPINMALIDKTPSAPVLKMPHIFVSLGTVYNDNLEFFQTIINVFSGTPYQVIISTGAKNKVFEQLGAMNALYNVRIVDFINQAEILKVTDIFITHGGLNSVSEAICNLVPMLVIPQAGDQVAIAEQLKDLNASKVLKYNANFSEEIHPALDYIFTNWDEYQSNLINIKRSFIDTTFTNKTMNILSGLIDPHLDLEA